MDICGQILENRINYEFPSQTKCNIC